MHVFTQCATFIGAGTPEQCVTGGKQSRSAVLVRVRWMRKSHPEIEWSQLGGLQPCAVSRTLSATGLAAQRATARTPLGYLYRSQRRCSARPARGPQRLPHLPTQSTRPVTAGLLWLPSLPASLVLLVRVA